MRPNRTGGPLAGQLRTLYGVLDATIQAQAEAKKRMLRLGRCYGEIQEFRKMAGVGPIGSHVFDAFIQTPHRFKTRSKLWRYYQNAAKRADMPPSAHEDAAVLRLL